MVCYEGKGIPVDIEALNTKEDIGNGEDLMIVAAMKHLRSAVINQ